MDIEPTFKGYIEDENDALLILQATLDGSLKHIPRRPYEIERPYLITSGSIFIFIEEVSGIKRWTDGVSWSPSRISGKFLIYRELDKSIGHQPSSLNSNSNSSLKKTESSESPTLSLTPRIKLPPILATPVSTGSSFSSNVSPKSSSPPTIAAATTSSSSSSSPTQSATKMIGYISGGNSNGKYTGFIKKTMSVKLRNSQKNSIETLHMVSYYNLDDLSKNSLVRPSNSDFFKKIRPCRELSIAMENTALGNSNKSLSTFQMSLNSNNSSNNNINKTNNSNSPLFPAQKLKVNAINKNNIEYLTSTSNSNAVNSNTAGSTISVDYNATRQQNDPQSLPFVKNRSFHSIFQNDENIPTSLPTPNSNSNSNLNPSNPNETHFQRIGPASKPLTYQPNNTPQQPQAGAPPTYYDSGNQSHSYYQPIDSNPSSNLNSISNSNSNPNPNPNLHGNSVQFYPINARLPYYQTASKIVPYSNTTTAGNNNYQIQGLSNNTNVNINGLANGNELGMMVSPSLAHSYANFSNYTSQPTSLPNINYHQPPQIQQQAIHQQQSMPFYQHHMALHPLPVQTHTYSQPHPIGPSPSLQFSSPSMNASPFLRHPTSTGNSSAIYNHASAGGNTKPFLMSINSSGKSIESPNTVLPQ